MQTILLRAKIIKFLLLFSFFTSFITYNLDIKFPFFLKFITISELFSISAIVLFSINFFSRPIFKEKLPRIFIFSFLLIFSFGSGFFVTNKIGQTTLAIAILGYLLLYSFVIYKTFKTDYLPIIKVLIVTLIVMSLIGFYDFIAIRFDYGTIFPNAENNLIISGFRYFGQTGDYTFGMLVFFIPFQFSNLSKKLSFQWQIALRCSVVMCALVLIGTGRISGILSLLIAFVLWIILIRNFKILKSYKIEIILISLLGCLVLFVFPEIADNIIYRFESRISNREVGTLSADFIVDNFNFAINSFKKKYIFGFGLESLINPINNHEIHGTYLKILAETGIVGMVFYLFFLGSITIVIYKKTKKTNTNDFFRNFFPFFLASLVMWFYEYHLRKKEFWIILALILIISEIKEEEIKKDLVLQNE